WRDQCSAGRHRDLRTFHTEFPEPVIHETAGEFNTENTERGGLPSPGVLRRFFFVPCVLNSLANDRAGEVEQRRMLTTIEKGNILQKAPVFQGVRTESLARVAAIAREVTCDARQLLFRENEGADTMFLILE